MRASAGGRVSARRREGDPRSRRLRFGRRSPTGGAAPESAARACAGVGSAAVAALPGLPSSYFGYASGGDRGDSGYPLLRLVALMALRSHLIAGVAFGPYATGEQTLAADLWSAIPDHSLTINGKNFLSADTLLSLQRTGTERHWLVPAKKNTTWRRLERFGRGDELIDPVTYPAAEIVTLYHERWEIELGIGEVKTDLLDATHLPLRSTTPEPIRQELWGILLAYNLIRLEIERIADEADVQPIRISFVTAAHHICLALLGYVFAAPGAIPKRLRKLRQDVKRFILPPRRTGRCSPRAVKVKMSSYPKKRRPPAEKNSRKRSK